MGVFSSNSSYLTDSTNSPFCQFFVNQRKVCGEVSYNLYENSVVAFEFVFSNVDQDHISKIREYFDSVIQRYALFLQHPIVAKSRRA